MPSTNATPAVGRHDPAQAAARLPDDIRHRLAVCAVSGPLLRSVALETLGQAGREILSAAGLLDHLGGEWQLTADGEQVAEAALAQSTDSRLQQLHAQAQRADTALASMRDRAERVRQAARRPD